MKYIKSLNNYYYKEYKGGKRKRISKDEYYRNNIEGGNSNQPTNQPINKVLNIVTQHLDTELDNKNKKSINALTNRKKEILLKKKNMKIIC